MPTPMTQQTYDAIVKINPDFGKKGSQLNKAFVYKHNLLLRRSGNPSGKGVNEEYKNYNSEEGVNLAKQLHDEVEKGKKDKTYRPKLYEGEQFAKENMQKGGKPYDVDKANAFFMRKGTETIPVKDRSGDENIASEVFDEDIAETNAPYKKEEERTGASLLKFPMKGRELKRGVDPKSYEEKDQKLKPIWSTSMATPPIGNGTAMPGTEPGISKNQFAKNDGDEMQKKMKGFKFNSLMTS